MDWLRLTILAAARGGYGLALRILPPGLAALARGIGRRVAHRLDAQPGGIRRRLRVPGPDGVPVLLVVAVGADGARLEALVRHLAPVAARLVWVTDVDDPRVVGPAVLEWMPRAAGLTAAGVDADRVRRARMALLMRRWRPDHVVVDSGAGPLPDLMLLAGILPRPTTEIG